MASPPARPCRTLATLVASVVLILTACSSPDPGRPPGPGPTPSQEPSRSAYADASTGFQDLEARFDARLGVYALDSGSGVEVAWRADERFAYASTIKAMAAAAVLDEVGIEGLEREVPVEAGDIVPHSPVTETHVGETMPLGEVAEAAMILSDNTAANYLFEVIGGPSAFAVALAEVGDDVTTVSRIEPDLNEAAPGDERDTTTPRAIAGNLNEYVFGDVLTDEEVTVFTGWLTDTQTGDTLVRANLPGDWTVGDKSGAGGYGTRGDIGVIWPTDEEPIVIAVLSSRSDEDAEPDDRLIAEAAEVAVAALH